MNETQLRTMIRKQILESLNEKDSFLGQVGSSVRSKLGSRRQQLDRILATINTDRLMQLPKVQKVDLLVALTQKFGIDAQDFSSIKSRVQKLLSTNDTGTVTEAEEPKISNALAAKGEKLENTQAYKMLMKSLETKPMNQQVDFAIQFLNNLPLDDSGKKRLKMKIRQYM